MGFRAIMAAALAGLIATAAPAEAQQQIGVVRCAGSHDGQSYAGPVLVDLWYANAAAGNPAGLMALVMRGDLARLPGTVRLLGDLRDGGGNIVNFEVFLHRDGSGTGSYWINHARHRESHMRLVLGGGGFDIYPEEGGSARFACRQ